MSQQWLYAAVVTTIGGNHSWQGQASNNLWRIVFIITCHFQCCCLPQDSPQLLLLLLSRRLSRLLCWDVRHLDWVGRIEVDGDDSVTLDNLLNTGHLFHTLVTHPKSKFSNKYIVILCGFYRKRRINGLDWSFDDIGELCSTLYSLTNIPSGYHKLPISPLCHQSVLTTLQTGECHQQLHSVPGNTSRDGTSVEGILPPLPWHLYMSLAEEPSKSRSSAAFIKIFAKMSVIFK